MAIQPPVSRKATQFLLSTKRRCATVTDYELAPDHQLILHTVAVMMRDEAILWYSSDMRLEYKPVRFHSINGLKQ